MVENGFSLVYCFAFVVMVSTSFSCGADDDRKVYIVYMGALPRAQLSYSPQSLHLSLLQEVIDSSAIENSLVRSYQRSFNGFAAKLTHSEKEMLASKRGVVSVFPSRTYYPETTRSWDFMGLNETVKRVANVESDTVVGLLDTGIWPDLPSFDDKGFGPIPKKWKGVCKGGANFTCNKKVIGARFYITDDARDRDAHGTHTASTAAGNRVKKASFYGLAKGTARGGVPSARLAIYKVCANGECNGESILAAFDDAIADGVDVLSVSLGGDLTPLEEDPIAIGSFHAMAKGILTINSAGNNGPISGSVNSLAPWTVTVAASTMDRTFIDKVELGNGKILIGNSVNSFSLNGTKYPLIYGEAAGSKDCSPELARECSSNCLDSKKVKGKIVLCDQSLGSNEAVRVGAMGSIELENYPGDDSRIAPLPATPLTKKDLDTVKAYLMSEKNPVAEILKSETIENKIAPIVAQFSSRGPNKMLPDILKPDLTAPGVNILAAYSPAPPLSRYDSRHVKFSVLSGTSMACPHVAGVAAYVKTFHQDWSPGAIKSALMTTARAMNASKHVDVEFAYGSGHIDPVKAIDPGLVYDALKEDYLMFFCGLGYDVETIKKISGDKITCPKGANVTLPRNFNSPSLSFRLKGNDTKVTFHRTVTNVGNAKSTYKAKIRHDSKLNLKVNPKVLSFKSLKEKKKFSVTVTGDFKPISMFSASLEWSDGIHIVRSPIVLYTDNDYDYE